MEPMQDILIVAVIFYSIVAIIKIISDNRIRNKLIEKGLLDENTKYLYTRSETNVPSTLKWGLVLVFLGGAVLVAKLFNYQDFTVGFMFAFAGAGLILFYGIARKLERDSAQKK